MDICQYILFEQYHFYHIPNYVESLTISTYPNVSQAKTHISTKYQIMETALENSYFPLDFSMISPNKHKAY